MLYQPQTQADWFEVCTMARKIGVRAQFGVTLLTQTGNFSPNWDPTPNLLPSADAVAVADASESPMQR